LQQKKQKQIEDNKKDGLPEKKKVQYAEIEIETAEDEE
jgi:hypothetical protein